MRRLLTSGLCFLTLFAWHGSPALAWNKAGHQVSGAIAYQVLQKESPETVGKVVTLLKQLPTYKHWEKRLEGVPAEDHAQVLFMLAARWADDIRGQPEFDHPKWHYINFPFKPDGQPDSVRAMPPDRESILEGFRVNLEIAKKDGKAVDRAVALCWVFHLVGDVHQPLHTTGLFTTDYPQGDRGGNLIWVRVKEGGRPINLHAFWDGLVLGSQNTRTAKNLAFKLLARPEFAREKLTELTEHTTFDKWARDESFALAKKVAYKSGKLPMSKEADSASVLPEGYVEEAKAVANRRIVLAGYRLADLLKATVK